MNATQEQSTFPQKHPWITVDKYDPREKCHPEQLYLFCSSPNPLPPHGRPTYRNNEPRPIGASSYYNIMWDGRICRGRTTQNKPQKSFIEYFNVRNPRSIRPNPERPIAKLCSSTTTRLSAHGKGDVKRPTTNFAGESICYLEELPLHLGADQDWQIQDLEDIKELPPHPSAPPQWERAEAGTQVYPQEILDHSYRIKPITEALVGKVVEQAILELLEEEELACLRDQDALFKAAKEDEEIRLKCLEDAWIASQNPPTPGGGLEECDVDVECYMEEPWLMKISKIIESCFNLGLNKGIEQEMGYQNVSRLLLDDLIQSVVEERQREYLRGSMFQEDYMDDRRFQRRSTPIGPED